MYGYYSLARRIREYGKEMWRSMEKPASPSKRSSRQAGEVKAGTQQQAKWVGICVFAALLGSLTASRSFGCPYQVVRIRMGGGVSASRSEKGPIPTDTFRSSNSVRVLPSTLLLTHTHTHAHTPTHTSLLLNNCPSAINVWFKNDNSARSLPSPPSLLHRLRPSVKVYLLLATHLASWPLLLDSRDPPLPILSSNQHHRDITPFTGRQ